MNFPSQMLANIETAIARLDPHAPDYAAQRASLEGMASEHRADMARCWGDTNPLALPAGKFVRIAIRLFGSQADFPKQHCNPLLAQLF